MSVNASLKVCCRRWICRQQARPRLTQICCLRRSSNADHSRGVTHLKAWPSISFCLSEISIANPGRYSIYFSCKRRFSQNTAQAFVTKSIICSSFCQSRHFFTPSQIFPLVQSIFPGFPKKTADRRSFSKNCFCLPVSVLSFSAYLLQAPSASSPVQMQVWHSRQSDCHAFLIVSSSCLIFLLFSTPLFRILQTIASGISRWCCKKYGACC